MTSVQVLKEKRNVLHNNKHFNLFAFCLIAAMILIAYSNTFTATFHLDDISSIEDNPYIKRVTLDNIKQLLHSTRPVVNLTLLLNYQISGLNVAGWHIVNTAFHIANSIFVYLFILWTLDLPLFDITDKNKAKRMALISALLFAVHPIQTESVTYIISRTELLAAFFYLSTFLLFIRGRQTNNFRYYSGAFFTSLLAMGSKEWAVTLPAVLFLYDYMFLSEGNIKSVLKRWNVYVLLVTPWGLIAYILTLYKGATSVGFGVTAQNSNITPLTYLLTSFNVLWTYIRLMFLPIHQNLDYDYPIAKTLFEFPTLLSFIGHCAVVTAAFLLYRKKRLILIPFGIAWFYITIAPVQSFVPILDIIFEHRMYLPSIGIILVFITAYEEIINWWDRKRPSRNDSVA